MESGEKVTFGRLLDASGFSRGDLKTVLYMADFYDIVKEKNGFYWLDKDEFLFDWILFLGSLRHELIYSHLQKRNNFGKMNSKNKKKNKKRFAQTTQKPVRVERNESNIVRSENVRRKAPAKLSSDTLGGGFGGPEPSGNGYGMMHFEWNDKTAIELYNELQNLREKRKNGELDDNDFDRFAMK